MMSACSTSRLLRLSSFSRPWIGDSRGGVATAAQQQLRRRGGVSVAARTRSAPGMSRWMGCTTTPSSTSVGCSGGPHKSISVGGFRSSSRRASLPVLLPSNSASTRAGRRRPGAPPGWLGRRLTTLSIHHVSKSPTTSPRRKFVSSMPSRGHVRHSSHGAGSGSYYGTGGGGGGGAGDAPSYGLLARRAVMAMGMAYVWTEYVVDMTLCEGPSMSPTIQPYGEIVVMDKWNPRHFGLKDGDTADLRSRAARKRQLEFEKIQRQNQKSTNDRSPICWHEPILGSATERQPTVTYMEMWHHMRSPISIGDVLVVQHPRRKGTVCKRVVGLPGDQILLGGGGRVAQQQWSSSYYPSASSSSSSSNRQLLVVPDGHVWLEGDNPGNSSDSRHYGPVPAALIVGRVLCRAWPIRGNAWMVRARRPDPDRVNSIPRGYHSATTVVLPAGYDGQPILKQVVHDALVAKSSSQQVSK